MSTITLPIWQKYYPEDIQSDDASTTTTTINDTDYTDTDLPSQRSDTDTSGTTTRSMSLPRPPGTTIRLPAEGTPSPSSSSSSLNKEKLKDKLMHDRDTFSTYLPLNFFPVSCGDKTRFSELCSQFGWHDSHLIQKGSLLPKGLQPEMGAQLRTWEGCPDEKTIQKILSNLELWDNNFFEFTHGNYNDNFFWWAATTCNASINFAMLQMTEISFYLCWIWIYI